MGASMGFPRRSSHPRETSCQEDMNYPLSFPSSLVRPAGAPPPTATTGQSSFIREYDIDKIMKATDRFNDRRRLGQGETGVVFTGKLLADDGIRIDVAVKRFHDTLTQQKCELVRRELERRRFLQHRNVVRLRGYCLHNGRFYLVYDYMLCGGLHKNLFDGAGNPTTLTSWAARYKIIRGAAQGLHHFHRNDAVHGCVTASNILIEKDNTARLGDFGYSWSRSRTNPPAAGKMSREMDVLCFGAVVLEVVTGRRSSGGGGGGLPADGGGFGVSLVDWVWALHGRDCILDAVDAALVVADEGGALNRDAAKKALLVGLACSHPDPDQRPKIENVVEILNSESVPPPDVPPSKPAYP